MHEFCQITLLEHNLNADLSFAAIDVSNKALQNGKLRHLFFLVMWRRITESDAHSKTDHLILPGPTQKNLCCRCIGAILRRCCCDYKSLWRCGSAYLQVIPQPQTRNATQRYQLVIK